MIMFLFANANVLGHNDPKPNPNVEQNGTIKPYLNHNIINYSHYAKRCKDTSI